MAIRDSRDKNWFWLENECIDLYTKHLGVFVMAVFLSLCRHADHETQQCYPSMKLIADELGISTKTVERATKKLEKWNFISVTRSKNDDGTQANNLYTLLSRKDRKKIPSDPQSVGIVSADRLSCQQPTDSDDISRQTPVLHNNTHNSNKTQLTTPRKTVQNPMINAFNDFWFIYPSKKSKSVALVSWLKIDPALVPTIINDVKKRHAEDSSWIRGYIPNPSTYLNQKRWEDDITPLKEKAADGIVHKKGKFDGVKELVVKT